MSAPAPQTPAERAALRVAEAALLSRDVAYGIPDAIVSALHKAGLLSDPGQMQCAACDGAVGWIDCPTGGWWAHETHPADDHDAQPMPQAATA